MAHLDLKLLRCFSLKFLFKTYEFSTDIQYKSSIVLYDDKSPIIPFSEIKTEYKRRFGKAQELPIREKVHGQLNQTTTELLEALRDHDSIEDLMRSTRSV